MALLAERAVSETTTCLHLTRLNSVLELMVTTLAMKFASNVIWVSFKVFTLRQRALNAPNSNYFISFEL